MKKPRSSNLFLAQLRDIRGREKQRKERKREARIQKRTKAWRRKYQIAPGVYKEVHPREKGRRQ